MEEVSTFLIAEDANFGDVVNLETQLKDSNALLDDIKTLKSKLGAINSGGLELCSKCDDDQENDEFRTKLQHELETINRDIFILHQETKLKFEWHKIFFK